mgnify:CR=1 FL=1
MAANAETSVSVAALIIGIATLVLVACVQKVPITNRKQVSLIPESELMGMSFTEYDKFLKANKVLPATDQNALLVQKVGKRIQSAVEAFMKEKGLSSRIEGYKWEFNTVDEATVNAWCMPGGKIAVYTGLLKITKNTND